jgi:hypothetical protein
MEERAKLREARAVAAAVGEDPDTLQGFVGGSGGELLEVFT